MTPFGTLRWKFLMLKTKMNRSSCLWKKTAEICGHRMVWRKKNMSHCLYQFYIPLFVHKLAKYMFQVFLAAANQGGGNKFQIRRIWQQGRIVSKRAFGFERSWLQNQNTSKLTIRVFVKNKAVLFFACIKASEHQEIYTNTKDQPPSTCLQTYSESVWLHWQPWNPETCSDTSFFQEYFYGLSMVLRVGTSIKLHTYYNTPSTITTNPPPPLPKSIFD